MFIILIFSLHIFSLYIYFLYIVTALLDPTEFLKLYKPSNPHDGATGFK